MGKYTIKSFYSGSSDYLVSTSPNERLTIAKFYALFESNSGV